MPSFSASIYLLLRVLSCATCLQSLLLLWSSGLFNTLSAIRMIFCSVCGHLGSQEKWLALSCCQEKKCPQYFGVGTDLGRTCTFVSQSKHLYLFICFPCYRWTPSLCWSFHWIYSLKSNSEKCKVTFALRACASFLKKQFFTFQVKNGFGQGARFDSPGNHHLWRTWVIEFYVQYSILVCLCTVLGDLIK